jgi:hypothetical protein
LLFLSLLLLLLLFLNFIYEYWLKVIDERAKDCSVILVGMSHHQITYIWHNSISTFSPQGTHLDSVTEEKAASVMVEMQTKYQKYTNVKYSVAVSCKTNRYMEKLKDLIISLGSSDSKIKETYPIPHLHNSIQNIY